MIPGCPPPSHSVAQCYVYVLLILDFLPMKCDACEKIFCKDHFIYRDHNCPSAYKKDVQVPLCPLCGRPVPVPKGVLPDVGVGQHMDNDCKAGAERRKGITTRCTIRGCKQRDFVQVICSTCGGGFCIRHRHPPDHEMTCAVLQTEEEALQIALQLSLSDNRIHLDADLQFFGRAHIYVVNLVLQFFHIIICAISKLVFVIQNLQE
uniref:AN1-type domain-containing protein n=1 Tax=Eptatretus burgeri TaxID=7764 RepID=A0A8C4QTD5_EPTBU